jgi:putative hydrolase of HD superfamily
MRNVQNILMELDQLKNVYRRSYLADSSRKENSAEHSWHLGVALLALKQYIPSEIDLDHAVRMALVHDICEIGPGDISIYSPDRVNKAVSEKEYIAGLISDHKGFALEIERLWEEYEQQKTPESRWVKVADRLLPFLLNLATEGRTWREQSIRKQQVLEINRVIAEEAPIIFQWMIKEIDRAVELGWLQNS